MSYIKTESEHNRMQEVVNNTEDHIVANVFWEVMEIKNPPLRVRIPLCDALDELYEEAFENGRWSMHNELRRNGLI